MPHDTNTSAWRWVRTRATGTAHLRVGLECQDWVACREITTSNGTILAAVVSDGAGSVPQAARGAKITCHSLITAIQQYFQKHTPQHTLEDVDDNVIRDWITDVRARLIQIAYQEQYQLRDYSATLVAVLDDRTRALVIHIGDGAAVVRVKGTEEWIVPSWPFHGHYASMTVFITDFEPSQLKITRLPTLDRIAVFSDGIENLVLDHVKKCAHTPFFSKIFTSLEASSVIGHDRTLSRQLKNYLESENVCNRTTDDKSLILGCSIPAAMRSPQHVTKRSFTWLKIKKQKEEAERNKNRPEKRKITKNKIQKKTKQR